MTELQIFSEFGFKTLICFDFDCLQFIIDSSIYHLTLLPLPHSNMNCMLNLHNRTCWDYEQQFHPYYAVLMPNSNQHLKMVKLLKTYFHQKKYREHWSFYIYCLVQFLLYHYHRRRIIYILNFEYSQMELHFIQITNLQIYVQF